MFASDTDVLQFLGQSDGNQRDSTDEIKTGGESYWTTKRPENPIKIESEWVQIWTRTYSKRDDQLGKFSAEKAIWSGPHATID